MSWVLFVLRTFIHWDLIFKQYKIRIGNKCIKLFFSITSHDEAFATTGDIVSVTTVDAAWLSRTENRVSGEQTPESPQPAIPL
ncbi:hypothetical protein [Aneurinibacillus migulanus]|uniref:hypothetical protein n=1 Tax=Aneurinibacillus migulanus TaxID=47500 RepID=UPI00126A754D|nr:hypothetical protein [Aneurinibacillus migulanus]